MAKGVGIGLEKGLIKVQHLFKEMQKCKFIYKTLLTGDLLFQM